MDCFKEHPVLRQLDELPQDSGSSGFTLVDAKPNQATLDEVWNLDELAQFTVQQLMISILARHRP